MSTIKLDLKNIVNKFAREVVKTKAELATIIENGTISRSFYLCTFAYAAAAEIALAAICFTPEFINGEIEGNSLADSTDEAILTSCKEISALSIEKLTYSVSLSMDASSIATANGLSRVIKALKPIIA